MFIVSKTWQKHPSTILGKDICFYSNDGTKYDEGIIDSHGQGMRYSIKLKSGSTTEHDLYKERWEISNYDGEGISLVWGGEFSCSGVSSIKHRVRIPSNSGRSANINIEKLYDHSEYTIPRCEGEHSELMDGNSYIIKPSKNPRNQYLPKNSYFLWTCDGAQINPITGKFYCLYHHI